MKKLRNCIFINTIVLLLLFCHTIYANTTTDFRGVWISTIYSADFPSVQNDPEKQQEEFISHLNQLKTLGINQVLVQVRPRGDAFYVSDLNPWSHVLTGVQGQDPMYDVMEFMITETHKRGMEFHAWLNPYRITTSGTLTADLAPTHMALQNPDWVLNSGTALYFNPALPEVTQYLCDTVAEIVSNYNVDGIHFDDYFYPSNYPLPEGELPNGTIANERRGHINDMIQKVGETIKSINPSVSYGISPMGIWKNISSDTNGSNTKGTEGYYTVFADALDWIQNGYIDYITPQIYWEIGNEYADYTTLVKWWSEQVKGTNVALYIGQGIYKDVVSQEITEQLLVNEEYDVDGSIFFSMRDLLNDRQGVGTAIKKYYSTPTENTTTPVVIEKKKASVTNATVFVNGTEIAFETYTIDDYSYFKLRDIATALNHSNKPFNTIWDNETSTIHIIPNTPYDTPSISGTLASADSIAITSTASLMMNNESQKLSAFQINDYTYYKLRDLGKLLDFGIVWDETTQTIGIDTSKFYE